jgi:hypothetical protein
MEGFQGSEMAGPCLVSSLSLPSPLDCCTSVDLVQALHIALNWWISLPPHSCVIDSHGSSWIVAGELYLGFVIPVL